MPKLPLVSGKTAIEVFIKIGYQVVRKKGSHFRLHHPNKRPLTIPDHQVLGKGLLRKLLRDSELSPKDFLRLVKR